MKSKDRIQTIIGYVDVTEDDDDIDGLTISTDEEVYIVEMNRHGRRLLDEAGSEVEATGVVKQDKNGKNIITITNFEVLEDKDDDYYEDEDDDYYEDDRDDWD